MAEFTEKNNKCAWWNISYWKLSENDSRLYNYITAFITNFKYAGSKYAPGVPPPKANNVADDGGIKFHDPNEFRDKQQPLKVPIKEPGRHHRHQHGAKINFEDKDARE